MSLAPDNEFHQLSLTGGYALPYKSRLTGMVSMGRMTQNQAYNPYTVNSNASPSALPQTSLDGEVWLTNAQLKLTSRPINSLRLNAELRYNERDNKTRLRPMTTYYWTQIISLTLQRTVLTVTRTIASIWMLITVSTQ